MVTGAVGAVVLFLATMAGGCASDPDSRPPAAEARSATSVTDTFAPARAAMVEEQIRARGIRSARVLEAMRLIPRHRFVPRAWRHLAYADQPLPIGYGQTISQPYIVAYMTEAARISPAAKVLEIGTGSGYQAAVLSLMARTVYTIEIVPQLADEARKTLAGLGYSNVETRTGNGYLGWPEQAPFDAIVVTAAPEEVPAALIDQLAPGGRMVVPVGAIAQDMMIIEKTAQGIVRRRTIPVRFVPMTGAP